MEKLNKLKELTSILSQLNDVQLRNKIQQNEKQICLLHITESVVINKELIEIYDYRSKNDSSQSKIVEGLKELVESFKRNIGEVISIYTLTFKNDTLMVFINLTSKKMLGCIINHEIDLEKSKILWKDYLKRGLLDKSYHAFDNMKELDVIDYLK